MPSTSMCCDRVMRMSWCLQLPHTTEPKASIPQASSEPGSNRGPNPGDRSSFYGSCTSILYSHCILPIVVPAPGWHPLVLRATAGTAASGHLHSFFLYGITASPRIHQAGCRLPPSGAALPFKPLMAFAFLPSPSVARQDPASAQPTYSWYLLIYYGYWIEGKQSLSFQMPHFHNRGNILLPHS